MTKNQPTMANGALDCTFRYAVISTIVTVCSTSLLALLGWRLFEFDAALLIYAQALIAALGLTVYRFAIWTQRPPTLLIYQRAWEGLRKGGFAALPAKSFHLAQRIFSYFALNRFVWKRGLNRWAAHWPIMIGCVMALAIVVPLIFGWVWFETPADDFHSYKIMLFGIHLRTIPVDGIEAFLAFHGLVWASFPVLAGVAVAIWRRLRDRGDQATQTFGNDIAPLLVLGAIAITGLLMTISYSFLGGAMHSQLAKIHCAIVVGTLLWLPFSKLFHIPQRSLKLAHMAYDYDAQKSPAAECARCGNEFASLSHIEDLISVQQRLGYRYEMDGTGDQTADHYQWICPKCRRATLVLAQSQRWRAMQIGELPHASALSEMGS